MKPRRSLKKRGHTADDGDPSSSFVERRQTLTKDIDSLRSPQRLYMPGVESSLDMVEPNILADRPETVDLRLPSALPPALRDTQCVKGLPEIEYRLRVAQATSALHKIRFYRQLIQTINIKAQTHITNTQKTSTRTRSMFDKAKAKQGQAVTAYRVAWKAIKDLSPNEEFGRWKSTLKKLEDSEVRGPGREPYETSTSRFVQSWIWSTAIQTSTSVDDPDLNVTLRVEWCKAQERAKRYEEEVELVIEEMRQTLVTFELNACDWDERAASPYHHDSPLDPGVVSGATAYAYKQADIQRKLVGVFLDDWYDILENQPLAASWLSKYPRPSTDPRHRLISNVQLYHLAPHPGTPEVRDTSLKVVGVVTSNAPTN